jgi:hypothetical protein
MADQVLTTCGVVRASFQCVAVIAAAGKPVETSQASRNDADVVVALPASALR